MQGICKLCQLDKKLSKSHAIPNSIFKRILSSSGGQAILIRTDNDDPIKRTQDSWWEFQLCQSCEAFLNTTYEIYAISVLRGASCEVIKHKTGITFNKTNNRLISLFIISVIWRAVESKNTAYSKVVMPAYYNEYVRQVIFKKEAIPIHKLTIEISRLEDKSKYYSLEILKNIVISPFFRIKPDNRFAICFLLEGFFIEVFIPGHLLRHRTRDRVIYPSKNFIIASYIDIFDIPEIVDAMATGLEKLQKGNSHDSLK